MTATLFASLACLFTTPAVLAEVATPGTNVDYTGSCYLVKPSYTDETAMQDQTFAFACEYQAAGGGGSTQMEVYLLTSFDGGTTWRLAASLTPISSGEHVSEIAVVEGLGQWVAVVTKLTGTPKPTQIFKATLLSNGRFSTSIVTGVTVDTTFAAPGTSSTDASQAWVTEQIRNLVWKTPVRVCTAGALAAYTRVGNVLTANVNAALGAIDGIAMAVGDRLLLKDGAAGADNGIYVVTSLGGIAAPWVLTRAEDCNSSNDVQDNMAVLVSEGATNVDMVYRLVTNNPITLNTTPLVFSSSLRVPNPTSEQEVANRSYISRQAVVKLPARAATTGALAAYTRVGNVITGNAPGALAAIDGVTLVVGERLLLLNGAAGQDNGLYSVTTVGDGANPFVLTRTTDMDESQKVRCGLETFIEEGTTNAGMVYRLTTLNPITLNTTALVYSAQQIVPLPTQNGQIASRRFLEQRAVAKLPVFVATEAPLPAYTRVNNVITANAPGALPNIDGVAVAAGQRILLTFGAVAQDNGIYDVTSLGDGANPFILTRSSDMDDSNKTRCGIEVYIEGGTLYVGQVFRLTTANPITLNTTALAFSGQQNFPSPTLPDQAATRDFVENQDRLSRWKPPVRAATVAALAAYTRTGNVIVANAPGALAAIDGVALVVGNRFLLLNGAAGQDNGIWQVDVVGDGATPFRLTRPKDMDADAEATCGVCCYVEEGTALIGRVMVLTTPNPITLNTTVLAFAPKGSTPAAPATPMAFLDADRVKCATATFPGGATFLDVVFAVAFPDANYHVGLTPLAAPAGVEDFAYLTNKAAGGFRINFSANYTGDVDWIAIRRV